MLKAGQHSLTGLILRRVNYGENDVIVTILTRDYGRISGLAKNARKSIRRFGGGVLSPGALAVYHMKITPDREMGFLDRAEPTADCDLTLTDPLKQAWASLALELANHFEASHNPAAEVFDLLIWYLTKLNLVEDGRLTGLWFVLKYLGLAGFAPFLESCNICGQPLSPVVNWKLSPKCGGALCRSCAKVEDPESRSVPLGAIKTLASANKWPLESFSKLKIEGETLEVLEGFLWKLARYNAGYDLRSLKVIKQLMEYDI